MISKSVTMAAKRPFICIVSEIPRLFEVLGKGCGHTASKIAFLNPTTATGSEPELQQAEIIVSEPHHCRLWLYDLPNLKLVLGTWAGVDSLMKHVDKTKLPSFTFCRYGEGYGKLMAEYVIGHMVAYERDFQTAYDSQRRHKWNREIHNHIVYKSRPLSTMSIGILGIGCIGQEVARVCKSFNMEVWGMVNTIPDDADKLSIIDHYRSTDGLDEILSNCDYICSILPSTPRTRSLLDGDKFKSCAKKKAVFINVGRGDVCSESSIINALDNRWIRAAILDVVPVEPLPSNSPLWSHPNVTITPHVSAATTADLLIDVIIENINNYVEGKPLRYVINWQKGY